MPAIELLSDEPVSNPKDDKFNFASSASKLANMIQKARTPLIIGINGKWGSGKTSLMRLIQYNLKRNPNILLSWVDAWTFAQEEEIWRVVIVALVNDLKPGGRKRIDKSGLLSSIFSMASITGKALLTGGLSLVKDSDRVVKTISKSRRIRKDREGKIMSNKLKSIRHFREAFSGAVEKSIGSKGKYVIFIDDLGRVIPEKILQVLEAIKIFTSTPGCIFLIGCDLDYLEGCAANMYKEVGYSGKDYLEKIIQARFNVPEIEESYLKTYMGENLENFCSKANVKKILRLFLKSVGKKPRRIKRLINEFITLKTFSKNPKRIRSLVLLKLLCFKYEWPELYELFSKAYFELRENKFVTYEIWAEEIRELSFEDFFGLRDGYDDWEPPDEETTMEEQYEQYTREVKRKRDIQEKVVVEVKQLENEKLRVLEHKLRAFLKVEPKFEDVDIGTFLNAIGR